MRRSLPQRLIARNTGPAEIPAASSQALKASTSRPTARTRSSSLRLAVLVRPSRRARTGSFGPCGVPGSAGTGGRSTRSSILKPVVSERRRPVEANARSRRAASRLSASVPFEQVAINARGRRGSRASCPCSREAAARRGRRGAARRAGWATRKGPEGLAMEGRPQGRAPAHCRGDAGRQPATGHARAAPIRPHRACRARDPRPGGRGRRGGRR